MEKLVFTIDINAGKQKVWETMLQRDTYKEWVSAGWPGSDYVGNWEHGQDIRFMGASGEGTKATLVECKPFEYVLARHVAVLLAGGAEDSTSDLAKGWIGTTESYSFAERNGKTTVTVEIHTNPEWAEMFNEGWPAAVQKLKEICEN